jgi:type II secretory pathway component PulF
MGREIRITVRLSKEEKEQLKKIAESKGMTVSDYVRSRLTGVRRRRKPKAEELELYRQLIYELNRVGVNLNQIARTLNRAMQSAPNKKFFSAVIDGVSALRDIQEELREILWRLKKDDYQRR